jgi:hypothetical protein
VLSNKSGDQQARAELLGKLLVAAGEKAYMLKHGSDKDTYFMIMVPVPETEAAEWAASLKRKPVVISMGKLKLIPLPLEGKAGIGSIEKTLYDPDAGGWTSTVALMRFK